MVNDLLGGRFAHNLRRMFGMADSVPADDRCPWPRTPAEAPMPNNGTVKPHASDMAASENH